MDGHNEENFRKNHDLIGKVVFMKDRDMESNSFEREVSKWVPTFYYKMHSLCTRKPRFSEMRPMHYNI